MLRGEYIFFEKLSFCCFLIPICLLLVPNGSILCHLNLVYLIYDIIHSLKYQKSSKYRDCKDIGIRKSEFVAKTQFLLGKIFYPVMYLYGFSIIYHEYTLYIVYLYGLSIIYPEYTLYSVFIWVEYNLSWIYSRYNVFIWVEYNLSWIYSV